MAEPPFLICYDGSDAAGNAIRRAAAIVGEAPALVVNAWLPPSAMMLQGRTLEPSHPLADATMEFDATARQEAERLTEQGARIATDAGFDVEPITIEAPDGAWRPILELAEKRGVRGIVVGSRGRSTIGTALLGSVSRAIAEHSRLPVILVPG